MHCEHCGHTTAYPVRFCPECGRPIQPDPETSAAVQPMASNHSAAYTRADYDPGRDGRPLALPAAGGPGRPGAARVPDTGMIVFSVLNMIFIGLGFSFVLGCIALILTLTAGSEPDPEVARGRISTARTLNIIGLVFILIQTLLVFLGLFAFLILIRQTAYVPG
ncbi:MAG: hypothetical protein EOM13_03975 [Clostridia bacterium]|nr:hypothetical protein [Eubacteriales bacterium]NCC48192.1 hypothetical protein [Clostridia bacterium]